MHDYKKKVTPITFLFERVARTSSHGVYFAACSRLNLFQYSAKFQTKGIQVEEATLSLISFRLTSPSFAMMFTWTIGIGQRARFMYRTNSFSPLLAGSCH